MITPSSQNSSVGISQIRKMMGTRKENDINLGLGELGFPTPDIIVQTAQNILATERIGYTENSGLAQTKSTVATYYKSNNPNGICICTGAQEALFATLATYCKKGDKVLVANPTFLAYQSVIKLNSGTPISFNLDRKNGFRFSVKSFQKALDKGAKIVVLNTPSNPTGVAFSKTDMRQIVDIVKPRDTLLIVDEIYRELYHKTKPASFFGKADNIIVISGLSKSHIASGFRLGWLASSNQKLVKPIITTHQYLVTCASYISQRLAQELLLTDVLSPIRAVLKTNLGLVRELFGRYHNFSLAPSDSHPFAFVKVPIDDVEFANNLQKMGVTTICGSAFGSQARGYIRINYALETALLKTALLRIQRFIENETF